MVDAFNDNKVVSRIMIDGGIAEINETSVVILAERAEKLDKSNRQVFEEKLIGFKAQENDADQNVSSMAVKNSSFMKAVLDNIN